MTEGEENIIIKGVLLEAISRDFSEELSNNKEISDISTFQTDKCGNENNPINGQSGTREIIGGDL